jgi:hypothetical protein
MFALSRPTLRENESPPTPSETTPPMPTPQPRRRSAPPPEEPKKFPVLQVVLAVFIVAVGVGTLAWVFLSRPEKKKPVVQPPPVATKPAPKVETKPKSLLKEVPDEIKKEVYKRLSVHSDRVDKIERELITILTIEDPQERLDKINEKRDELSECAEGIDEILHDPKYAQYQTEEYGPYWGGQEKRQLYYTGKLNELKKHADRAFNEVKLKKDGAAVK